ncbi:MAG: hypothetical protein U9N37_07680 [Thermodesulfobacteriota bacterium]|nr:hypothetical protein [Thermodesulfobacteriota bacterium]
MTKESALFRKFEDNFIRDEGKLSFDHSLKLFTSMWDEGLKFGVLPSKNPLEGIDVDVKIAKVLNSCSRKSFPE